MDSGFMINLVANAAPPMQRTTAGGGSGGTGGVARPPLDIEWNWNTRELYACGQGGVISTYRQQR